jgi:hypothetical protein
MALVIAAEKLSKKFEEHSKTPGASSSRILRVLLFVVFLFTLRESQDTSLWVLRPSDRSVAKEFTKFTAKLVCTCTRARKLEIIVGRCKWQNSDIDFSSRYSVSSISVVLTSVDPLFSKYYYLFESDQYEFRLHAKVWGFENGMCLLRLYCR